MTPIDPTGNLTGNTPRQVFASVYVTTLRSLGLAVNVNVDVSESQGIDTFSNGRAMAGMGKEEVGGKVRRD